MDDIAIAKLIIGDDEERDDSLIRNTYESLFSCRNTISKKEIIDSIKKIKHPDLVRVIINDGIVFIFKEFIIRIARNGIYLNNSIIDFRQYFSTVCHLYLRNDYQSLVKFILKYKEKL